MEYDDAASGLNYDEGSLTRVEGTHFVHGTKAEIERWKQEETVYETDTGDSTV